MKMSGRWFDAVRFALGVLLVWGALAALSSLAHTVMRRDSSAGRLSGGEFCTVEDFTAPNIWAPTGGYVYDREYQINPGPSKPEEHLQVAAVDWKTLVMVNYDMAEESIKKGEPGRRRNVDGRLVNVFFISGTLSGRRGMIARYKLEPREAR